MTLQRESRRYETLFRLATSLHQYPDIDSLLDFITDEIITLIDVEGTTVLLLDTEKQEFYFSAAAFTDGLTAKRIKDVRFASDRGVAGEVLRTGRPMIVDDTSKNPLFFEEVDSRTGYRTRTMLDVPIRVHNRIIGVLSAVNKQDGRFNVQDMEFLSAIADTIAHPIENARINQELNRSYQEVTGLSKAKDKVIHHLSHELKTPLSVVSASLDLIEKKIGASLNEDLARIFTRARRNLQRLLEMQYEIEDLLKKKDYSVYHMMKTLFDACVDELEVLVTEEMGGQEVLKKIERRIDELFGPRDSEPEWIRVDRFVEGALRKIGFRFAHRECRIIKDINPSPRALIPEEVLMKVLEGLVRNAVENTPDKGEIRVTVRPEEQGTLLEVEDFGVGITEETMGLLFENYFTAYDPISYSTGAPYDFGAGGKGFDLLRMNIFSEQYGFRIRIRSERCRHIIEGEYACPGNIDRCTRCTADDPCESSGGTLVSVWFPPVGGTM